MNHIVLFSGGIGSWAATLRVAQMMKSTDQLHLAFTDTLIEDEDLYRFLLDAAADVAKELQPHQGKLWWLADGRDVWEVFRDVRFIGNTRADPCSMHLKRRLARKWVEALFDPANTIVYLGIDWTEEHRYQDAKPHWEPWELRAPLCDPPYREKPDFLDLADERGLKVPRLYELGFPHNNCGGFCVKQGQGGFKLLLEHFPERYAYHESKEEEMREYLDKDVAILRDRRGGETKPLTMKTFRERLQEGDVKGLTLDEFAGCGCMVDFGSDDIEDTIPTSPSVRRIYLEPGQRPDPLDHQPMLLEVVERAR